MKKEFSFEDSINFIERTIESYTFCECSYLSDEIITYAEYAVRNKLDGNDKEAGLFMAAAVSLAHLYNFQRSGRFFRSEMKKEDMDIKDLILHYILNMADAEFNCKPYETEKAYRDDLIDAVEEYILIKDSSDDDSEQQ